MFDVTPGMDFSQSLSQKGRILQTEACDLEHLFALGSFVPRINRSINRPCEVDHYDQPFADDGPRAYEGSPVYNSVSDSPDSLNVNARVHEKVFVLFHLMRLQFPCNYAIFCWMFFRRYV